MRKANYTSIRMSKVERKYKITREIKIACRAVFEYTSIQVHFMNPQNGSMKRSKLRYQT